MLAPRDVILFHHEGGVDIGDVESKAARLDVTVDMKMEVSTDAITDTLLTKFQGDKALVAK